MVTVPDVSTSVVPTNRLSSSIDGAATMVNGVGSFSPASFGLPSESGSGSVPSSDTSVVLPVVTPLRFRTVSERAVAVFDALNDPDDRSG